jgi:maltose/moltooligosaccharide transporter
MKKPALSFWQIWNMSFGFMGIQFGWGLQLANMSGIYAQLGAEPDRIPILWLAGPMTGLLVQPIIGSMSDRTWNRLGRRRPYFLVGAILSSLALFLMPTSGALWMAAGLLWVLDASINISMEPFRAFVADKLPDEQRTAGFVMQSFFIGIGQTVANVLPFLFARMGVSGTTESGVSLTVKYSFQLGAAAFLLCVLYTVLTTKEYPPADMEAFHRQKAEKRGLGHFFKEIIGAIGDMPAVMKQLAVVQIFTWLGLFCMWMFFGLMTSYHIFKAPNAQSELFRQGGEWNGICFMVYSIVCFIVAFAIPKVAAMIGRKTVHSVALFCGGLGLLSTYLIQDQYLLLLTMVGIGIAWASILSMPYAILSSSLPPERMGVYMGVFNFFIVIPEIVASLTFQPLVKHVFQNNPLYVVMLGGVSLLLAAALVMRVRDTGYEKDMREIAAVTA